jgi:DNA-binding MarR family transcriptional regulator
MQQDLAPTMTCKTPSEISALSQRVGKMLRAFGRAREQERMTSDETLIFLALGHLGQTATSTGMVSRPVTCLDLADLLNIPKETVRRKVSRLVEMQLVMSTTRGVLMENEAEWRRLAEAIAS